MNALEKRSFYSFLVLYILSSLLFLTLVLFWYYTARKQALENETFYRLQHLADTLSGKIITAHMQQRPMPSLHVPKGVTLRLIRDDTATVSTGYFQSDTESRLITDAPQHHLGIAYLELSDKQLPERITALRKKMLLFWLIAALFIVIIARILSKLFMRPLQERVAQVERFVNDITHELNTPVSSLKIIASQALQSKECDPRALRHISICTKQLYDIYRSLSFLNFDKERKRPKASVLHRIIDETTTYYQPLAEAKAIILKADIERDDLSVNIPEEELKLLLGNLLSNAIKYSPRHSTIEVHQEGYRVMIEDEGIGIAEEKLSDIFEKFRRATDYAGGFGVGLSVVKRICDEYGIKIEIASKENEGTRITLDFT